MRVLLEERRLSIVVCGALSALWLIPLWDDPGGILFWRGAEYTDLLISHLPNAAYIHRALAEWGQLPLWNATHLSGIPLMADPLAGVWYLPNWIAVLLPFPVSYNLLSWLHLTWAGLGMWRFMRAEGVGTSAAAFSALAFSGSPKVLGHLGLGHVSLVFAVTWTPWMLYLVHKAIGALELGVLPLLRRSALAGASLGLIFLIDPRWALPGGALAAAYAIHLLAHSHRGYDQLLSRSIVTMSTAGVMAALIASGLALPLIEFVGLSTRSLLEPGREVAFALPPEHLLGFLIPDLGGWPEWLTYAGIVILVMALVGALSGRRSTGFWALVALVATVLALGDRALLYDLLLRLGPGMRLLRVPARMLFLSAFAISTLAGFGFEVCSGRDVSRRALYSIRLSLLALASALLIGTAGLLVVGVRGELTGASLGASALAGLATLLAFMAFRSPSSRLLLAGIFLLAITDLAWVQGSILESRPFEKAREDPSDLLNVMAADPGDRFRVFSPSYSVPMHFAVEEGIELADGINPLQLISYYRAMAQATGFSEDGYSVTLPPFPSGDPSVNWGPRLDLEALGRLNIAFIAAAYAIDSAHLRLIARTDQVYLYENGLYRPRAWVNTPEGEPGKWMPVSKLVWSPNRLEARAAGPGQLVFSEISYPGWKATVDGEPVGLIRVDEVLRGVNLPEGMHDVRLTFHPRWVYLGAALSAIGLLALGGLWVRA